MPLPACTDIVVFQSTLPRGERHPGSVFAVGLKSFNPRSHVGSDFAREVIPGDKWFQSTLPRGERHLLCVTIRIMQCFNPRSHVGSDALAETHGIVIGVSIHAPAWGATLL